MRRLLMVAIVALFTTSCALFSTPDMTGALEADMERERLHVSGMEAFSGMVSRATGWTDEQKAQVQTTIMQNIADYAALAQRSHVLLDAIGDIDWRVIAAQAVELYRDLDISALLGGDQ